MSIQKNHTKIPASQALASEFDVMLQQNLLGHVDADLARRIGALSEVANPPSNNMGGHLESTPPFVSHREKNTQLVSNKTKIDWLAATSGMGHDAIRLFLAVLWPSVLFSKNSNGMPGYPSSDAIMVDGVRYGQIAYGAPHGRDFFVITGTGCRTLDDELLEVCHDGLVAIEATLSRIDICLDSYRGERTFEHAMWARENGAFKRPNGSNPDHKVIESTAGDGSNLGRTLYVGRRGGEVMARIYEKGLEVFANMPEEFKLMSQAREIVMGTKPSFSDTWLRVELEFRKQDKSRLLPLDMILNRDSYFVGAYPYCRDCIADVDPARPKTLVSEDNVEFIKIANAGRRSYGSFVHTCTELGFSDSEVVALLTNGRINDRLVKSGLFGVMKKAADDFKAANPDWEVPF